MKSILQFLYISSAVLNPITTQPPTVEEISSKPESALIELCGEEHLLNIVKAEEVFEETKIDKILTKEEKAEKDRLEEEKKKEEERKKAEEEKKAAELKKQEEEKLKTESNKTLNETSNVITNQQNNYSSLSTTLFSSNEDQAIYNSILPTYQLDPSVSGLSDHVAKMKAFLGKKFGITSFSLYRPGDSDGVGTGHGDGLAIDLMVPVGNPNSNSDLGDEISAYLAENFNQLGINYIIWEQKFYMKGYSIYGPGGTWNWMEDRGSITQNHYDHVHISFKY